MSTVCLDDNTLEVLYVSASELGHAHPVDILRLVEEVRWYKTWVDCMARATGYDPREEVSVPHVAPERRVPDLPRVFTTGAPSPASDDEPAVVNEGK